VERKDLREMAWPLLLTVLLAGLFTWAYLARPAMLEHMELGAYDLRLQARGRVPDSGRVALVAVDEDSLRRVGRWPWSREVMAQLVERLDGMGVLSVGFDIGFFDPQPTPARDELLALIQQAGPLGLTPTPELRAYLRERLRETNPDGRLALALRDSGPPVVLGYYFGFDPAAAVRDETVAELAGSLGGADSYPLLKSVAGSGRNQEPPVPRAFGGRANIPLLADTVRSQAYFNVLPDQDGTVRAYQMAVAFKDGWYQPLAAALFSRAVPEALPSLLVGKGGLVGAEWGRHVVPTDPSGRMLLNYRGPGGTIPHVPAGPR
jgi:adenylate cyclase